MGWAIMIAAALVTGGCLYPFVRRGAVGDWGALQFLAAALLLALAGYSWQGHPSVAGSPKGAAAARQLPNDDFANIREDLLGRFDRAWTWTNMAESYRRRGDTHGAAQVLESAVRNNPNDAKLWTVYGYELTAHSGMMTPAAQLAFRRAAALAPDHPAPAFFYALALAQTGNFDEAERVWRGLLPGLPAQSQYRTATEERLRLIAEARAMGRIPPSVPAS